MPEGTRIERTDVEASDIAGWIGCFPEVEQVSFFVGRTPPRYYLSNASFGPQPNFAQLLVKCSSSAEARALQEFLQDSVRRRFPEPLVKVNRFELNTQPEALIEARFLGPDPAVLDSLVGRPWLSCAAIRRWPTPATSGATWR